MPSRNAPNGLRFRPRVSELEDRAVPATLDLTGTTLTFTLDPGVTTAAMTGTATALTFNAGTGNTVTANAGAVGIGFTTGAQTSGPGDLTTVTALNIVGAGGTETFTIGTGGGTFPAFNIAASVETTQFNLPNPFAFSTGGNTQTYNGAVALLSDAGLTGSSIAFNGAVNGAFNLNITATGATTFVGAIGGTAPLGTLGINTATLTAAAIATTLGVNVTNSGAGSITGVISGGGAGGMVKGGVGALTLSGANTYTGFTDITGGTVVATNAASLGTTAAGTTVAPGATLDVQANIGTEPITVQSLAGVIPNPGNLLTSVGTGTVGGPVTLASVGVGTAFGVSVGGAGNLTISGVIGQTGAFSGDAITKVGAGVLTLSGTNTYTSGTGVTAGTLVATNSRSLGTTAGGTTVSPGATLDVRTDIGAEAMLVGGAGVGGNGAIISSTGAGTVGGPVLMTAATTIGGAGNLALNGDIGGGFALTVTGAGLTTLGGVNTYSGATTVNAGSTLIATNAASLGTTAAGTTVLSGGVLNVRANIGTEPISIAGTGVTNIGALRTSTGFTGVVGGPVTLTAASSIGNGTGPNGGNLTINGVIGGAFALGFTGNGITTLTATNTYTGLSTVTSGRVILNGSVPGQVLVTGGTFGGNGTAGGAFQATGGTVAPAATATTPVTLKVGNTALGAASTFAPAVGAAGAATGSLAVTGTVNLSGGTLAPTTVGAALAVGQAITVIDNDGTDAVTGTFAGLPEGATVTAGGQSFTISYVGGTGNDVVLTALSVPGLTANLGISGQTNGTAGLFAPDNAGQYASTATATLNPFGSPAVNVRTAIGDVNGDGTADTILVTGPGVAIRVAVISGVDNSTVLVAPFDPFGGDFTGGGFVSAADLDRDGKAEFAVTPDQGGGPRVSIFAFAGAGTTPTLKANFFGIDDPAFRGGARSALGDVNGDGTPDMAVCAGFLGGPRTALFNGTTLFATPTRLINDFFAFPGTDALTLRNGVFVALGDVDGDGKADLIFGGGPGGAPRVFILSGATVSTGDVAGAQASPIANFFVAGNTSDRGGVRLTAKNADGDTKADVVAASGEGSPAKVRIYLGKDFTSSAEPTTFQDLTVFGGGALSGGVFVG